MFAAAKKEREAGPQVPDWVLDNSIKFNGNAGAAAASAGVTGSAAADTKLGVTLVSRPIHDMVPTPESLL